VRLQVRDSASPAPILIDQRGVPTHECLCCGSNIFVIRASFEDYEVAAWFLEGECAGCGCPVTVPCPADDPERI
jgi:hypothetical protein